MQIEYKYQLVEIIPHSWCIRIDKIEDKEVMFKGIPIKKLFGKYTNLIFTIGSIHDKISMISLTTCISKIRLINLKRNEYACANEVMMCKPVKRLLYKPNKEFDRNDYDKEIENYVNWYSLWRVAEDDSKLLSEDDDLQEKGEDENEEEE